MSIEERLVKGYSFTEKEYTQVEIVLSPPSQSVYLGELEVLYSEGIRRKYIFKTLKERAGLRGADIIYIKEQKKIQAGFLMNSNGRGNQNYITKNKKVKIVVSIYRKQ